MTDFYESLNTILTALDKKGWLVPLQELHHKFIQVPEFDNELICMLHSVLDAHKLDPGIPVSTLAAIRLSSLECWSYRFQNCDHDYLNPLTEPVEALHHSRVSQSNSAYPAIDIVKRWARDHLQ